MEDFSGRKNKISLEREQTEGIKSSINNYYDAVSDQAYRLKNYLESLSQSDCCSNETHFQMYEEELYEFGLNRERLTHILSEYQDELKKHYSNLEREEDELLEEESRAFDNE